MSSKNFIFKECLKQNIRLIDLKLSFQNFGNLSLRLDSDHFVIKPSGANLKTVKYSEFPIINIKSANKNQENLENNENKVSSEDINNLSEELDKLNNLLKEGALSKEEFEKAKKKILDD